MKPTRMIVFFLLNLITLGLADYEDSGALAKAADPVVEATKGPAAVDDATSRPLFSKFEWTHLVGDPPRLGVSAEGDEDLDDPKPRGIYWVPTTCDSFSERGYTCLACGESLHCMAANFGLKAICFGQRPFCRNGVCSHLRGEKCSKDQEPTYLTVPVSADEGFTNTSVPIDPALTPEGTPVLLSDESAGVAESSASIVTAENQPISNNELRPNSYLLERH